MAFADHFAPKVTDYREIIGKLHGQGYTFSDSALQYVCFRMSAPRVLSDALAAPRFSTNHPANSLSAPLLFSPKPHLPLSFKPQHTFTTIPLRNNRFQDPQPPSCPSRLPPTGTTRHTSPFSKPLCSRLLPTPPSGTTSWMRLAKKATSTPRAQHCNLPFLLASSPVLLFSRSSPLFPRLQNSHPLSHEPDLSLYQPPTSNLPPLPSSHPLLHSNLPPVSLSSSPQQQTLQTFNPTTNKMGVGRPAADRMTWDHEADRQLLICLTEASFPSSGQVNEIVALMQQHFGRNITAKAVSY